MNAIQFHVSALLMVCACLLPKEQHAQCVYRLIDTFDDETPINAESLVLTGCNQLMPEMENPKWHNVFGDDDADWLPKQGGTPTSSTGPFATSYVLPGSDLAIDELSPSYLGSLPFGSMPPPLFVPTPSIMSPIVIPDAVVDALSPYTSVWPGPGGVLGSTYLYVEATGCCNGTAILESESLSLEEYDDIQLAFRYHMLGINQGELTVQTSVDDGENWENRWTAIGNQGQFWKQASVDLTSVIGGVEGALIRIVATVGGGELSDIAIDDITILGSPPPLVVFEDSTLTYAQTMESCWIQVEFDKPSDSGLPCHPEPMLDLAELRLNLSLGDDYKYGGTDFGEDGIELRFALNAINASGQVMGACSAVDSITLQLADDRHPEQLYVHDFSHCYNNIDHFELQIGVYDTAGVEYPSMVDDLEFHITVDIEERFHAHGNTAVQNPPVLPTPGVLAPVQFSWEADCDYPSYRFQLLRLHPVGTAAYGGVTAYASYQDWIASALTLEVNEPFLELTMMEGSGVYAWRVMPIGNEHPGGEANDMNFGTFTSISPLGLLNSNPQTLSSSDVSGNAAFFSWTDPNDDVASRNMARAFSRNNSEGGESLLVRESVQYKTEDGFESQAQLRVNSQGLTLVEPSVRDLSGRDRLSILPVPISDEDKGQLNYESELVLDADGTDLYGVEDFDGDDTFMEPAAMTGEVADYYSDANIAEPGVPNADGYPFTAMTYTRDATNRPVAIGAEGPVKRLRDDGQERTTRILYSAVGNKELTRIFGHEAPSTGAVDKIITIDPENVTRVAYVDEQGRTIATCLSQNSSMDSDKIVSLAPAEGFSNAEPLESDRVTPYRWEVFHEMSFSEQTNLVLDYALDKLTFSALCDDFCAQCDYEVITRLVKTSDRELEVIFSDEQTVEGSVLTSCGGSLDSPLTFSLSESLTKGTYVLTQSVTMHNMNGDESYLQSHISAVREEVTDRLDAVTVGLEELLDAVVSGDEEWLYEFYDYCEANSSSSYEDDEGITWYTFDVGEDCDAIEIPVAECPYDCNPDTRDFEAFFNSTLEAEFLAYIDTATSTVIPARDNLNYIVTGRSLVDGSIAISGNYPLFPTTPAVEGGIRNVAAESYGVADGEFNQLIENLIADGDAYPEYYPGYDCYNIHYKLEAIAENHIYYLFDTVVVDKLMDELGYHFKDTRNWVGEPGEDASGNLVDSSVSEGEQGWKSHPHKFVKIGEPGTIACTDEESVFAMASIEAGLEDLDYTIEAEREEIESIYMLLHNCLHGESEGDVQEELTESDDETASEWGADGITAENLERTWEQDCEEAVRAKESVYSDLAKEVLGLASGPSAAPWTAIQQHQHDCIVAQLTEHALALCKIPSGRMDEVGTVAGTGTLTEGYYKVEDSGSGEFIRYGLAEYGPYATDDVMYASSHSISAFGTSVDYVKSVSPNAAYFDYEFTDTPAWTQDDIEDIAGVMYGAVAVCTSDCDSTFTELPLLARFPIDATDTLLPCVTFDPPWCTVNFDSLPIPLEGTCSNVEYTHIGGGFPQLVLGQDVPDVEVLVSSYPDTTSASPAVLGNGIRIEGQLTFTPGETYEVSLDLAFEDGIKLDHFFAVISPFQHWKPECAVTPLETFYPAGNTEVIANWENVLNSPNGSTIRLTQEFVWEGIQNPGNTAQAPNHSFSPPYSGPALLTNQGFLHLYPKQYLMSDTAEVRIDNVCIVRKREQTCGALWVKYSVLEPVPDTTEIETCEQQIALQQLDRIASQREGILQTRMDEVEDNYFASCVPEDVFTIDHPLNYYQYTLFYYDAAGRLVRTVPPKGVDADDNHTRQSIPDHTHVTEYAYNGLGNLVRKETPDGDSVNTWYDRLERVRFTQTAQDAADEVFRYICYDLQSRPIRSGVKPLGSDVLDDHVDDVDWPDDPSNPADCTDCYERIISVYGNPVGSQFEQTHLVDRLSFMTNDMGDTIAYSYNATGQIEKLYQYVNGLGASLCEYEFDASSGLIQEIVLNRGRADEFHMRHLYDEDQRVTETFSSRDGRVWSRDGAAEYYGHGLLKRQELGHYGVQGQDFVYNIHQKLIGINTPSLEGEDDPGADGESGTHAWVSPDVFGLHLAHYRGEFGRDGSPFNASNASHDEAQDLFHDHIASTSFQQRKDFEDGLAQVGHRLQYDEEERVRGSTLRAFSSTWANDAGGRYSASFDYDPNGNLLSLTRTGSADAGTIDDVEYEYVEGKNWLDHIIDSEGNVTGSDLASQSEGNFQYDSDGRLSSDAAEGLGLIEWRADGKVKRVEKSDSDTVITFRYNPLGHRVAKITESAASGTQDTTWYIPGREGKIMAVYRTHGVGPPALAFNRTEGGTAASDPSGSAPLFGEVAASSDFYTRHVGGDRIEIKDHLGNVRTVVSDLELALDADGDGALDGLRAEILKATDYHAYGSLMDGRGFDSIPYRFGFQGKEGDPELKGEGNSYDFQARFYDPRLGRWLSTDPMESDYPHLSPYNAMGADPINNTDPSGEVIETLWDVANVGMGVVSLAGNVAAGNYVGAAVDAVGIVADAAAVVAPGVPGGAGTAIRMARAGATVAKHGPEVVKATKAIVSAAPDAVRSVDRLSDARKAADVVEDSGEAALKHYKGGQYMAGGGRAPAGGAMGPAPKPKPKQTAPQGNQVSLNRAAGKAAEERIMKRFPAGTAVPKSFRTSDGMRHVDVLVNNAHAIESKVGRMSASESILRQVAKDKELIANTQVQSVTWEFAKSAVTGKSGPTDALKAALHEAGIRIVVDGKVVPKP